MLRRGPLNALHSSATLKRLRLMNSLALVIAVGLLGPILTLLKPLRLPVIIGEILAGVAFGYSGLNLINASDSTLKVLAELGFGLAMLQAGSHIDFHLLRKGINASKLNIQIALVVGLSVIAALVAHKIESQVSVGIFILLFSTSSAAVILPILNNQTAGLGAVIAAVLILDLATVVAIPLVMNTDGFMKTILHISIITLLIAVIYLVLSQILKTGAEVRIRELSKEHHLGVELRISLLILISLAALAIKWGISILIVGFAYGLVLARLGVPRRLARQLFAVSEGFLTPLFYVWLGAQLNIKDLFSSSDVIKLVLVILIGSYLTHGIGLWLGNGLNKALLATAQLGVPTAISTIGLQTGQLNSSNAAAIMFAALVTVLVSGFIKLDRG
jgi:Kef-type K+ transport system membrane component KefB